MDRPEPRQVLMVPFPPDVLTCLQRMGAPRATAGSSTSTAARTTCASSAQVVLAVANELGR
jgi:hypothetical protein